MRLFIAILVSLTMLACGDTSTSSSSTTVDLAGFNTIDLGGAGEQLKKYGADNKVIEEGYMVNGKKNGAWISYYETDENRIKSLTHYINNELNGPSYEFNKRGQIEKEANYTKGLLNGLSATYKFGRLVTSTDYVNGNIEGFHKEFFQNGKIQKEIQFKDNKKNGVLNYYDEEGNVTLSYEYKNDEKVSGGMVE